MITVKLVGFENGLEELKFDVQTYKQALEALKTVKEFNPLRVKERYECEIREVEDGRQLTMPIKDNLMTLECKKVISAREMVGAGNSTTRFIVGVILITIAVIYVANTGDISNAQWFVKLGIGLMFSVGTSLVVGVIMEKLQDPIENDNNDSRVTSQYPTTTDSGTVIPIICGKHRWAGHLFTANIQTATGMDANINDFVWTVWNKNTEVFDSWNTLYRGTNTDSVAEVNFSREQGGAITKRTKGNLYPH